ncbi:hypothetical protein EVAR_70049_1 [Eumeta japonica]|uniref:Uncharacterized protein n=1 Tax=Eumeta variegata TaxID=151549 RepID=A0A4C2AF46_EUMVA|nr:hypothetical protein EVAR_70049_1 [Eumeta japonica]
MTLLYGVKCILPSHGSVCTLLATAKLDTTAIVGAAAVHCLQLQHPASTPPPPRRELQHCGARWLIRYNFKNNSPLLHRTIHYVEPNSQEELLRTLLTSYILIFTLFLSINYICTLFGMDADYAFIVSLFMTALLHVGRRMMKQVLRVIPHVLQMASNQRPHRCRGAGDDLLEDSPTCAATSRSYRSLS